jgi:hypothetical protein
VHQRDDQDRGQNCELQISFGIHAMFSPKRCRDRNLSTISQCALA